MNKGVFMLALRRKGESLMQRTLYISLTAALLFFCSCQKTADKPLTGEPLDLPYCSKVVNGIDQLHQQANESFYRQRKENGSDSVSSTMDPNDYFKVLTHLSLPEGSVLDTVYHAFGGNGGPVLYVRKEGDLPFQTFAEYEDKTGIRQLKDNGDYSQMEQKEKEYLTLIRADGRPESFFELAVYATLAGQYNLMWHANYFDTQVIVTKRDTQRIIRNNSSDFGTPLSWKQKREAKKIDPTPVVHINEDTAEVSLVLFSKWGGFFRRTFTYTKTYPHRVETKDEELVKYDCQVMF